MFMAYELSKSRDDIQFLFQNTGAERKQTYDFLNRCDKAFDLNLIWLEYTDKKPFFKIVSYATASRNKEPFDKLIQKKGNYLPNQHQRFCTEEMKVLTARRFIRSKGLKHWRSYVGFRYDEPHRKRVKERRTKTILEEMKYPLFENKTTSRDVAKFWTNGNMKSLDLELPILPNGKTLGGNCTGCFLKSEYERLMLCKHEPKEAQWYIEKEKQCGGTFKKGESWQKNMEFVNEQLSLSDEMEENLYCTSDYGSCTEF